MSGRRTPRSDPRDRAMVDAIRECLGLEPLYEARGLIAGPEAETRRFYRPPTSERAVQTRRSVHT